MKNYEKLNIFRNNKRAYGKFLHVPFKVRLLVQNFSTITVSPISIATSSPSTTAFSTLLSTFSHCLNPLASSVPFISIINRLKKLQLSEGLLFPRKMARATFSGLLSNAFRTVSIASLILFFLISFILQPPQRASLGSPLHGRLAG